MSVSIKQLLSLWVTVKNKSPFYLMSYVLDIKTVLEENNNKVLNIQNVTCLKLIQVLYHNLTTYPALADSLDTNKLRNLSANLKTHKASCQSTPCLLVWFKNRYG